MKSILPFILLLAACSEPPAEPSLTTGAFAGDGRDRLCLAGEPGNYRGGLIAYGEGDMNCSASGRIEINGAQLSLIPRGEGDCRIPLTVEGDRIIVRQVPAACSYYCGPSASMSGKGYTKSNIGMVTDLAGDPLC